MRAVAFDAPGEPEVLELREVPDPEPGPDELLVRVYAAGLNRADLLQRRGLYPPPPGVTAVPGLEYAGEVARTGEGVEGFRRGDRVFGLVPGGAYAEKLVVDAGCAVPLPDRLSFDAAAALPEACITAFENLFVLGGLERGDWALIHAGASGVGSLAIQLVRARGARAIATAGGEAKVDRCRELGAELAVDRHAADFEAAVRTATGGRGVDAILDLVGASYWERNLRCLADGGRLLVVGLLGGSRVELDLGQVLRRRLRILGNVLRGRSLEDRRAMARRFREAVLPRVTAGEVRPVIDSVVPFEEVREAHRRMEANRNTGKIILRL